VRYLIACLAPCLSISRAVSAKAATTFTPIAHSLQSKQCSSYASHRVSGNIPSTCFSAPSSRTASSWSIYSSDGSVPHSSLPVALRTIITQHAIIPRGAFVRSTVQCSTVSRHHPPHYHRFYRALGQRLKQLRKKKGYTQEDMISFGFGLRHWQQIEGGHPINISTLLRICEAFDLRAWQIIRGLDDGFPRSQRRDINARTR
jgi:hypothetical protein